MDRACNSVVQPELGWDVESFACDWRLPSGFDGFPVFVVTTGACSLHADVHSMMGPTLSIKGVVKVGSFIDATILGSQYAILLVILFSMHGVWMMISRLPSQCCIAAILCFSLLQCVGAR